MATMLLLLFFVAAASTAPVTRYGEAAPLVTPFHYNCNTTSAPRLDRTNTTFEANLEKLSTIVPANASASGGFFVGSLGAAPDTVFALALCRGDTIGADCTVCLESAFQNAIDYCSNAWDVSRVTIYQERCQVRFSDLDFLDDRDFFASDLIYDAWNPDSISVPMFPGIDPNDTQSITFVAATVSMLMRETAMLAAFNASQRFATALMDTGGAFPTLYSMAQCTPDFSPAECFACLDVIVQMIPTDKGRRGGRIMGLRCSIRYESDVFYGGKAMWIFGSTLRDGHGRKVKILTVTITLLLALLFCMIVGFWWICSPRKGKVKLQGKSALVFDDEEALVWTTEGKVGSELWLFDFAQMKEATSNFSEENKLGQGGFGPVYKGKLPDGLEIAVKRLCTNSGQGFIEFKNEVQLIAKLQHTNLVRLLGCCCQGREKMLVYEYLPNKSLDFFIFDSLEKRASLDWKKRLAIIQGIAQGLLYLHKHSRLHIIHRDMKASNILLDHNMNPKISDFGIAKIFISNDIEDNTNTVVGTCGYMAPEYAYEGHFSSKSDVFSFGVLLLEIVSGKRNSFIRQNGAFPNLLGYAWLLWKEGKWHELVDTSLIIENCMSELLKCINIALLCVHENAADRPNMWDVTTMLSTEGARLPEPNHPAYYKVSVANAEPLEFGFELDSINEVTITAQEGR